MQDRPATISEVFERQVAKYGERTFLRDKRGKAWQDLMVRERPVAPASCDSSALARNIEFGRKYRITGTPTLIFADGTRVPGAMSAPQVEKHLNEAKAQ